MQWRSQKLYVGADLRVEASKAQSGVRFGEGCPLPSLLWGVGKRRDLPQSGPGAANAFSAYSRLQNATRISNSSVNNLYSTTSLPPVILLLSVSDYRWLNNTCCETSESSSAVYELLIQQ